MKQANFIISQITDQPSLKKLQQFCAYKKLLALLPPRYQKAVRFMYNKNNTLFFVLSHPSYKMEFHYKKEMIKSWLNMLVSQDENCKCIDAEEIKFFISHKEPIEPKNRDFVDMSYKEKAKGRFKNNAQNKKINAIFEQIRAIIKQKEQI